MSKCWQIGGSPRRNPGIVCINVRCKSCEVVTMSCRINCAVCADRVDNTGNEEFDSGKGVKRGKK